MLILIDFLEGFANSFMVNQLSPSRSQVFKLLSKKIDKKPDPRREILTVRIKGRYGI